LLGCLNPARSNNEPVGRRRDKIKWPIVDRAMLASTKLRKMPTPGNPELGDDCLEPVSDVFWRMAIAFHFRTPYLMRVRALSVSGDVAFIRVEE
jgi:hypothetical protein